MGLKHKQNGADAYTHIDKIVVEKRMHRAGMGGSGFPAELPPMCNIFYITSDRKGGSVLMNGGLTTPLDLSDKTRTIYEIAYSKLKEQVSDLKDAEDDI